MVEGGSAEWLVGRDHHMGGCRTVVVAGEWENDEKEGKNAYVGGLVHVNPSSVDVESCS